ncbi:MAG: endolytic transglycosylase MltG [candidate division Zixibacteria bacterium]|nr:endolytic transglycosylase MltG [candidate division Zixibacteria bacterium]
MAKKIDDYEFKTKDKIWWWGSNLVGFVASIILVLFIVISIPFRRYRSIVMRYAIRIIFICLVLGVLIGGYIYYAPDTTADFGEEPKYMLVQRGETVYDIAYKLEKMGAISSEINFRLFSKVLGHSRKLKTGRYSIEPDASMHDIFDIITKGAAIPYNVTILEGLTIEETAEAMNKHLDLDRQEFLNVCSDRQLLDSLSISVDNLEGYLFPNTYNFFYDETPQSVVRKMIKQFYASLPDSFEQKAKRHGLDFHEAVTMASLIEKEAMLDKERPIISAVYHKRLKIRMRLQCDPTVIYAMGGLNRPLFSNDLKYNSPYNTYKVYGLPPGPICSPGTASLEAAVNPVEADYLYFVAAGDGSHVFTRSNREHINAKNRIKRGKLLGR